MGLDICPPYSNRCLLLGNKFKKNVILISDQVHKWS